MAKICLHTIIACFLSFALGLFAGVRYVAPLFLEQHHIGTAIEKQIDRTTEEKDSAEKVNWAKIIFKKS